MYHAAVLSFSTLSMAVPISRSRTGLPLRYATMIGRYGSARHELAVGLDGVRLSSPYSVPVGRFTFAF